MKTLIPISVLLFCATQSIAQPTLTSTNCGPQPGVTFTKKAFTPSSGQEGSAGANQVWDWSSVIETASGTGVCYLPSATPYAAVYPAATLCVVSNVDQLYDYFQLTSTGLYRQGFQQPQGGISSVYSNSQQYLKFPMSINTTFGDSYASYVDVTFDHATLTGTVSAVADGWGTLITPAGTFTNVLRIKIHIDEVYDYDMSGSISQVLDDYVFMKPDVHYPIAEYIVGLSGGLPYKNANYSISSVGINAVSSANFRMSIFPCPAQNNASIDFTLDASSEVVFEIMDLAGRVVKSIPAMTLNPGPIRMPFDASDLSNGFYLLAATINGSTATLRFAVER